MGKFKIIEKYLDILSSKGDLDELWDIFSSDLCFKGPFYQFDSAKAYIETLKPDPPHDFKFEIIETFEKDSKISVFLSFSKEDIITPMALLFEFKDNLIKSILLIFNGIDFA